MPNLVRVIMTTVKEKVLETIFELYQKGYKWFTKDFFIAIYKRKYRARDKELRTVDRYLRWFSENGYLKNETYWGRNENGKKVKKAKYEITGKLLEVFQRWRKDVGEVREVYKRGEDGSVILSLS